MMQKDEFFKTFGYNNRTIKCDFIDPSEDIWNVRTMFFLFEAAVPASLILICYACILYQVYRSKILKTLNETGLVAQILP